MVAVEAATSLLRSVAFIGVSATQRLLKLCAIASRRSNRSGLSPLINFSSSARKRKRISSGSLASAEISARKTASSRAGPRAGRSHGAGRCVSSAASALAARCPSRSRAFLSSPSFARKRAQAPDPGPGKSRIIVRRIARKGAPSFRTQRQALSWRSSTMAAQG